MLQAAKRLNRDRKLAAAKQQQSRSSDFTLKAPLSRVLAWNVGRGQPASSVQTISAAASAECDGQMSKSHSYRLYFRSESLRLESVNFSVPRYNNCSLPLKHSVWGNCLVCVNGFSAGTRWATTLGNKGATPQHIEERLHRASHASKDEASVQTSNSGFGLGFVNMCLCGCRCVCFRDQRKTPRLH